MAAAIERLRESMSAAQSARARNAEEKDIDPEKPRYMFSAVLRPDCRYEPCDFDWIEPGGIHVINTHAYLADNTARYLQQDEDAPLKIWRNRPAASIARRIIENEATQGEFDTGVVLLEELQGLDAAEREEDGVLLLEMQQTLLPDGLMRTGAEQLRWLESVYTRGFSGPEKHRYERTCARMIQATRQAIEYTAAHYAEVLNDLSQAAAGKDGYRNKAGKENERLITWGGFDVPQLTSPMVQSRAAQVSQPAQAPAVVPQAQCENCGTYVNLLSGGRLPKMCVGCGESFAKPEAVTDEAVEAPAELTRVQRMQAESRERKGK